LMNETPSPSGPVKLFPHSTLLAIDHGRTASLRVGL
jgi:hypothetical protein